MHFLIFKKQFIAVVQSLSRVQLCVTTCTVAHQAPLSWNSPGKNTGGGAPQATYYSQRAKIPVLSGLDT